MKKILCFTVGIIILSGLLFNANIEKISAETFSSGLSTTGFEVGYSSDDTTNLSLAEKIGQALSIATTFLGVVFLGLMIYAGFIWMMARGNEQEVAKAKNIIIYAVIGLVVVLAAYAITLLLMPLWIQSTTMQEV